MDYRLTQIPRPQPLVPGLAQAALPELEAALGKAALAETHDKLAAFLAQTQAVGVDLDADLSQLQAKLAGGACADVPTLCAYLLELDAAYCNAGEGLPRGAYAVGPGSTYSEGRGLDRKAPACRFYRLHAALTRCCPGSAVTPDADEATMAALLGEEPPLKAEEDDAAAGGGASGAAAPAVKAEPKEEAGAEPMDVDGQEAGGDNQLQGGGGGAAAAASGGLQAAGSSAQLFKEEQADQQHAQPPANHHQQQQQQAAQQQQQGKPPLPPAVARLVKADSSAQPSSAGVSQDGGGTETEAGTAVEQAPLRPVSADDEMDDSDAEHAHLREKRMRRPARVWRSARERAVWLRMVRAADTPEKAAYCAWIFCDRWAAWAGAGWGAG